MSSVPDGISCGDDCVQSYLIDTDVVLTATADEGSRLYRWFYCDSVTGTSCNVNLASSKKVVARFKPIFKLNINKAGTGKGSITSRPLGISCGATCENSYFQDTSVTLKATPAANSRFVGWYGNGAEACGVSTTCVVSMSEARQVTAQFDIVLVVGHNGHGAITSMDGEINCGSDCAQVYAQNTLVELHAQADADYGLAQWSGCSSIKAQVCFVNMAGSRNVMATFKPLVDLTVTKQGSASGVVRSQPSGIVCGSSCTKQVVTDSVVKLSATPGSNAYFMGWLGACSGTEACSVTMSEAKQVTAVFGRKDKQGKYWVMGYLPGYTQSANGDINYMRDIDWKTVTHVIHNSAMPNTDGSLNVDTNGVDAPRRQAAIQAAHAHGVPILFGLSGWDSQYRNVLADTTLRATFLTNVLAILDEGYDGIDVDFEPIVRWGEEENPEYEAFINELYAALQTRQSALLQRPPLLTVSAIYREHKLLARLQDKFDQINVMAYDQSGVAQGITWHDSALFANGYTYPTTNGQVVSVHYYMQTLLKAGIPASKLGLGISLETRLWMAGEGTATGGATLPYQTWMTAPRHFMTDSSVPKESFATLMDKYYSPDHYYWDEIAQVPYLSYDSEGSADDLFISYNDERSVEAKLQYMKRQGFGGMMLWQLQYDYRPNQVGEAQRPILTTIRNNLY